jgi:hypothetical protein
MKRLILTNPEAGSAMIVINQATYLCISNEPWKNVSMTDIEIRLTYYFV